MRNSIILTLALCFTPGCDKATEKKEDAKAEKSEGTGGKSDAKSDAKATGTAGAPDAKPDAKAEPAAKEAAPAPAKK